MNTRPSALARELRQIAYERRIAAFGLPAILAPYYLTSWPPPPVVVPAQRRAA